MHGLNHTRGEPEATPAIRLDTESGVNILGGWTLAVVAASDSLAGILDGPMADPIAVADDHGRSPRETLTASFGTAVRTRAAAIGIGPPRSGLEAPRPDPHLFPDAAAPVNKNNYVKSIV